MGTDQMIVTMDFSEDPRHVLGKLVISPDPVAQQRWKLYQSEPDIFTLSPSYIVSEDGTKQLNSISLVLKHHD